MEIPNFLNLPRYTITAFNEIDDAYHIAANIQDRPSACAHCAHVGLVGFSQREQWIRDLPMRGKRVRLYLYCPLTSFDGLILVLPGALEKVLDKHFLLD